MVIEKISDQDLDKIEIIIAETIEITKINTRKEVMAEIEMIIKKKIVATEMKEAMKEDNVIIKS